MHNVAEMTEGHSQLIIQTPHRLDRQQIERLNEVVDTVEKYEQQLHYMSMVCNMLLTHFMNEGQQPGSDSEKLYLSVRDVYHALLPRPERGSFSRYHGLQGTFNAIEHRYKNYR